MAKHDIIRHMKSTHRYFPVNDAQRTWGLYATCVGHIKTYPGDPFPSPVHPDEYFFSWNQGRTLREWQFASLAESLGVPYRTFRNLFAKETASSPPQYQLDIRLARAKNLLKSSDLPVAEIAKSLGFNSTWYFAHFFRQRMHTPPVIYRKKHKSGGPRNSPRPTIPACTSRTTLPVSSRSSGDRPNRP